MQMPHSLPFGPFLRTGSPGLTNSGPPPPSSCLGAPTQGFPDRRVAPSRRVVPSTVLPGWAADVVDGRDVVRDVGETDGGRKFGWQWSTDVNCWYTLIWFGLHVGDVEISRR